MRLDPERLGAILLKIILWGVLLLILAVAYMAFGPGMYDFDCAHGHGTCGAAAGPSQPRIR